MLRDKPCLQFSGWHSDMAGIARIAGQRFLNAFLDRLDGEVVADGRPATRAERL